MGREVSESCLESLLTEIVSSYCNGFYANKPELAARRIEAIGFQVGHQLSERWPIGFLYLFNEPFIAVYAVDRVDLVFVSFGGGRVDE
ncbi:trafficking particle complex subunit 6B [Olea europaea subsp. europaea]|uniref:Trafficking particle complex subunit 6B n=1 Tax=Olea europaea subsp. europaea TaxID=158383 RepID=A0A8S0RF79_OLEEU|nr:trafficking particle complex subunit 6B [Olea europaea subsp. europaea]